MVAPRLATVARFKVRIEGEELEPVTAALGKAHVEYFGPTGAGYESQESWQTADHMHAVVDADTADEAEEQVKEALPKGDYTVGSAEPLDEDD
jgi:hypothetical protein